MKRTQRGFVYNTDTAYLIATTEQGSLYINRIRKFFLFHAGADIPPNKRFVSLSLDEAILWSQENLPASVWEEWQPIFEEFKTKNRINREEEEEYDEML